MKSLKSVVCVSALAASLALPALANAGAVITSGPVSLGVNDTGELNFVSPAGGGAVGIYYAGVGDGISPGCLCEGWGVAGNGISGWRNRASGDSNISLSSFTSTASTATSIVTLSSLPTLKVTQAYAPSAAAPTTLFQNAVTIANTGSTTITGIKYRRVMDWDIPPTVFDEFVTIGGVGATNLVYSSDDGFASSDPLAGGTFLNSATVNTNFVDNGPADHGALFDFAFGDLAAGQSLTFNIFYGASGTEAAAISALAAVGAEVYSLGQSNTTGGPSLGTPATFIFGFSGVGGQVIEDPNAPVPEPATVVLLGGGLLGLAAWRKRRKA